ncbi:hypothetical protein YQE_07953, partial [Dendroctonus ponderosae]
MVVIFSRFAAFTTRHPVVRGMIAYGMCMLLASITNNKLPIHPRAQSSALCECMQSSLVLFLSLHAPNVAKASKRNET